MAEPRTPQSRDRAHNPGMYPNEELNWQTFGSQASAQSTEPHQPGATANFHLTEYFLQNIHSNNKISNFTVFFK